jgi:hypothetical protein
MQSQSTGYYGQQRDCVTRQRFQIAELTHPNNGATIAAAQAIARSLTPRARRRPGSAARATWHDMKTTRARDTHTHTETKSGPMDPHWILPGK